MSQQTRDILPMFDQCWASYVDVGTTLDQYYLAAFNCHSPNSSHIIRIILFSRTAQEIQLVEY